MTRLVDCPHCSSRVLPMAGRICPACRKNIDSMPDPRQAAERTAEAAYGLAAEQMRRGACRSEIQRGLTERGLSAKASAAVVRDLERVEAAAQRAEGQTAMLTGALWCLGGIAVTAATFQAATAAGGGKYVIAWGAILFGAIQFVRGYFRWMEP
jgi:hypothetical protein